MDWLKSAAQAAFAKGNTIPGLSNIGLGERQPEFDGLTIWTLYTGTKRDDDTPVSVFVYDSAQPSSSRADRKSLLQLARNALRKLRTLRHPDVVRFIDGSETDQAVYVVTEPVVPLSSRIGRDGEVKCQSQSALDQGTGEEWRTWGLSKIVNALAFINDSAGATHGNLRLSSVFVAPGGDWRLGGFELLSSDKDPSPTLYHLADLVPQSRMYMPPEAHRSGYSALKDFDAHAYDSFLLYLFMHLLFNGPLPVTPSETPTARGNIPPALFPHARRLYTPNGPPNSREKASTLWAAGMSQTPPGPFRANRLVRLADGLDSFALASEGDKAALVRSIKESLPVASGASKAGSQKPQARLPPEFLKYKVLPALVKSLELPSGGPSLLPLILALSTELQAQEYDKQVLPALVRCFASPDRAMRMAVLDGFPSYIDRLDKRTVVDKIWPNLLTGFSDTVPVIREATVKSTLLLAPKLTDRILNNDLLRLLAKTQMDPEPGIRTNTCILLGRLAPHLTPSIISKVLVPAFGRAMRDSFVHARIAGLMALMATADSFSKEDLAGRVLPSMGITLVDGEKLVRDQAFKAIEMILRRLEAEAKKMPETLLQPGQGPSPRPASPSGNGSTAPPDLVSSSGGAAGALAGWAMSSFVKKLGASDLESGISGQKSATSQMGELPNRPASVPVVTTSDGPSASTSVSEAWSEGHEKDAAWNATSDLMDVNSGGDDWDPLDEQQAEEPVPIEELAPIPPEVSMSRLSTSSTKKPVRPLGVAGRSQSAPTSKAQGKLKLGASGLSKPNKTLQAIEQELPAAGDSWDIDMSADFGMPEPSSAPLSKPAAVKSPSSSVTKTVHPAASFDDWAMSPEGPDDDGWSAPITAKSAATSKAKAGPSATPSPTAGSGSAGKSKVAQMREERKARLAALKQTASTPPSPVSTPPPASGKFKSGAQTQYRF